MSNAREALPAESVCALCTWFDINHPDVRRILLARDPTGRLLNIAKCRCPAIKRPKEAEDRRRWDQANLPTDAPSGRGFDSFCDRDGPLGMPQAVTEFSSGRGPHILVLVGGYGCSPTTNQDRPDQVLTKPDRDLRQV